MDLRLDHSLRPVATNVVAVLMCEAEGLAASAAASRYAMVFISVVAETSALQLRYHNTALLQ